MIDITGKLDFSSLLVLKLKSYYELLKVRLSFLVAFSSGFGYILGNQGVLDWSSFISFCVGGFLVSGGAITINQVLEREYDKVMKRTMDRPLPTKRVSKPEATIYAVFLLRCDAIQVFLMIKSFVLINNHLYFVINFISKC